MLYLYYRVRHKKSSSNLHTYLNWSNSIFSTRIVHTKNVPPGYRFFLRKGKISNNYMYINALSFHVHTCKRAKSPCPRVIAAVYLMKNLKSCEDYATQGQGDLPFCNTLHKLWWPKMLYLKYVDCFLVHISFQYVEIHTFHMKMQHISHSGFCKGQ